MITDRHSLTCSGKTHGGSVRRSNHLGLERARVDNGTAAQRFYSALPRTISSAFNMSLPANVPRLPPCRHE